MYAELPGPCQHGVVGRRRGERHSAACRVHRSASEYAIDVHLCAGKRLRDLALVGRAGAGDRRNLLELEGFGRAVAHAELLIHGLKVAPVLMQERVTATTAQQKHSLDGAVGFIIQRAVRYRVLVPAYGPIGIAAFVTVGDGLDVRTELRSALEAESGARCDFDGVEAHWAGQDDSILGLICISICSSPCDAGIGVDFSKPVPALET